MLPAADKNSLGHSPANLHANRFAVKRADRVSQVVEDVRHILPTYRRFGFNTIGVP